MCFKAKFIRSCDGQVLIDIISCCTIFFPVFTTNEKNLEYSRLSWSRLQFSHSCETNSFFSVHVLSYFSQLFCHKSSFVVILGPLLTFTDFANRHKSRGRDFMFRKVNKKNSSIGGENYIFEWVFVVTFSGYNFVRAQRLTG